MNAHSNSTAAPSATRTRRIGENPEPSYEIANLISLITVCSVALDGADDWTDEIACGIRQDVKLLLEWAALVAVDINVKVERLEMRAGS